MLKKIKAERLIICRHEGRVWPTTHRGRLWIAAAGRQPEEEEIATLENFYRQFYEGWFKLKL